MSGRPIRIQGGVFLWWCALLSLLSACFSAFRFYDGIGSAMLTGAIGAAVVWIVRKAWGEWIAKHGGSPQEERGPIWALSIAVAAVFVHGSFIGKGFLIAMCMASAFFFASVFTAKGLNAYDFRLSVGTMADEYRNLSENAQFVCIAYVLAPLLSLIFTLGAFLIDGLDFTVLYSIANLFVLMPFYMTCLAKARAWVWKRSARHCFDAHVRELLSSAPYTFYEYATAFATAGVVTLVFLASQRLLLFAYPAVVFGGFLASFGLEMVFLHFDRDKVGHWVRTRWRDGLVREILEDREAYLEQKLREVRRLVMETIDFDKMPDWQDGAPFGQQAEQLRRILNDECCDTGMMRYISSWTVVPRGELLKQRAEELLFTFSLDDDFKKIEDDALTDEQLQTLYDEITSLRRGNLVVRPEDCAPVRNRLLRSLDEVDVARTIRMNTEILHKGARSNVEIDLYETGEVRIRSGQYDVKVGCDRVVECFVALLNRISQRRREGMDISLLR